MNNILFVSSHPDDETLGCGGTILKYKKERAKIYWLIVTNMQKKYGWSTKRIKSRKNEINKVHKFYNFDDKFELNFPTCRLDRYPLSVLIAKISKFIKKIKPNTIFMPFNEDVHTDHQITTKAIQACAKWYRFPSIKKVLMYETLSETNFNFVNNDNFKPNVFINITDHIDDKIKIMKIYKSEINSHPFPRNEKAIKSLALLRGTESGYKAAESFKLVFER